MVVHGAQAGGFSPLSIYGVITNGIVASNNLPGSPVILFLASLAFNTAIAVIVFVLFGGLKLLGRQGAPAADTSEASGRPNTTRR